MNRADARPWIRTATFLGACILGVVAVSWWRAQNSTDAAWLLQALPEDGAVHFVADLNILRSAGLLGGPNATPEDPDYSKFVKETGFDYRQDLGTVAAAFKSGDLFIAAQGRFSFDKLGDYARAQGGGCANSVCQMAATRPGRNISFFMLRRDVLAMAVSARPLAVSDLKAGKWKTPPLVAADSPIWIAAPGAAFADVAALPAGTHAFLSPLATAQQVVFTLAPGPATSMELHMNAIASTQSDAGEILTRLAATTDLLKKMLTREKLKPGAADLTAVLASGRFETKGTSVAGVWVIDRKWIEALASGKLE